MKKMQYISPACKVINVNVQSLFLNFSQTDGNGIGQKPGDADGEVDFDVKGEGGFWDEW